MRCGGQDSGASDCAGVYPDNALAGRFPGHPIVIPPEAIVPGQDGKAHVVVYYGGQRITFTVEMPKPTVPTQPAPKA